MCVAPRNSEMSSLTNCVPLSDTISDGHPKVVTQSVSALSADLAVVSFVAYKYTYLVKASMSTMMCFNVSLSSSSLTVISPMVSMHMRCIGRYDASVNGFMCIFTFRVDIF